MLCLVVRLPAFASSLTKRAREEERSAFLSPHRNRMGGEGGGGAQDELIMNKYAFHWHIFCCTHIQTTMGLHVGTHKDKMVYFFLYANVRAAPQNNVKRQRQRVANGGPYQSPALAES